MEIQTLCKKCPGKCKAKGGDYLMACTGFDKHLNQPAKKKPRMVRIKAWARLPIGANMIKYIEDVAFFKGEQGCHIPITILIDRKYLKKGGGNEKIKTV